MIDTYSFKYAPSFCPPNNEAEAELMLDYFKRLKTALRANMKRVDFIHNPCDFDKLDELYDSAVCEYECLKRLLSRPMDNNSEYDENGILMVSY